MLDVFQYDFMVRAFAAGLLLSIVAPTIGIFFVVRRYSAMADTLAHVSLAGVAGGLLLGISTVWAAFLACMVAIFGMEWLRERKILSADTVVSLFLFGGLALGVLLIGLHPSGGTNVSQYLFGSILTVTADDVLHMALIGGFTLACTIIFWKLFFSISLDEEVAQGTGLPVQWLNRMLALLGAATIAISIHVVGMLLVGALMVIPVLTAMQFRMGFTQTWFVALLVSVCAVIGGLMISYYANVPSGATIVLCAIVIFLFALFMTHVSIKKKNLT